MGEHARRFLLLGMQSFPRGDWGLAAAHLPPSASQVPPQMGAFAGDSPRCSEQFPEPCGCCHGKEQYVKHGIVSSH